MSDTLPACPECQSEFTYEMPPLLVCSACAHEWNPEEAGEAPAADDAVIKDSVGNILEDGDTVTVVKPLKVKGSSSGLKAGTKVRNIRLNPGGADGHDIDCKVDGFGQMQLKSSVVKKVT